MKPGKLIPPEGPKERIRFLHESLRIGTSKRIPVLEAEKVISGYLDEVWENYGKLEDSWSNETAPNPYVNISRTVKLEIQVSRNEKLSVFNFWKAQYIPNNKWYWDQEAIENPDDELKKNNRRILGA